MLPTKVLQLQITHRNITQRSHHKRELIRDVSTRASNQSAQWSNIPRLHHAHGPRNHSKCERSEASNTQRQSTWVVPAFQIVVRELALPEELMLREDSHGVARAPISEQTEEVLQVSEKVISTSQSQCYDYAKA